MKSILAICVLLAFSTVRGVESDTARGRTWIVNFSKLTSSSWRDCSELAFMHVDLKVRNLSRSWIHTEYSTIWSSTILFFLNCVLFAIKRFRIFDKLVPPPPSCMVCIKNNTDLSHIGKTCWFWKQKCLFCLYCLCIAGASSDPMFIQTVDLQSPVKKGTDAYITIKATFGKTKCSLPSYMKHHTLVQLTDLLFSHIFTYWKHFIECL